MPVLSSNKKDGALYLPVCTHGYKNEKSAQKQIKSYIPNVKEFRLIHVETEEEYKVETREWIQLVRRVCFGDL